MMFFLALIFKNLMVRRTRSVLTLAGVAVAIGAVVALTGISKGFERSWQDVYSARGTEVVITKVTSQSPLPAGFPEAIKSEVAALPDVESVAGLLSDMLGIEDAPPLLVLGWESGSFIWQHLRVVEGRLPSAEDRGVIVLGRLAAELLGKNTGDSVQIETETFVVIGMIESSALVENSAVLMLLGDMQRLVEKPGQVNFLNVRLRDSSDTGAVQRIRAWVKETHPGCRAFGASDVASSNTGVQAARAMSWATSVIALVVGAFGVMNTVLMSVFERVREIGILLAIGWRKSRILAMVLGESILLSLLGGLAGVVLGFGAAKIVEDVEFVRGKLEADFGLDVFCVAMLIALVLGVCGGLYPAWRAANMQPTEALRYE